MAPPVPRVRNPTQNPRNTQSSLTNDRAQTNRQDRGERGVEEVGRWHKSLKVGSACAAARFASATGLQSRPAVDRVPFVCFVVS
jgi:hypothetical protein